MLTITRKRQLRAALRNGSYIFEPVIRLVDGVALGYEALLRLPPNAGFRNAEDIFATAARLRMARETEEFTAGKAVAEFSRTNADADSLLFYNLHTPAIAERSSGWLRENDAAPMRLPRHGGPFCIEISEKTLLDPEGLQAYLERWAPHPLIALDDFGTGYSSLARLVVLKPDFVKIDRMFVAGIVDDPKVASRLARIVDLVHDSGARTIVEGVETEAMLERCRDAGCSFAQGFLWGASLPSDPPDPGGVSG